MNIILLEQQEVDNGRALLTDRRAAHLVKVLRVGIGDRVRVGIIDGLKGSGEVVALQGKFPFEVELVLSLSGDIPVRPPIDLLLALPRPIMLRRIFSQAAALGVGTIFITHAQRVEKSFWNASLLQPQEYRERLLQGLEQAVDTRVPEVQVFERFKPFAEDVLPGILPGYSHALIAHPGSTQGLGTVIQERPERMLLAIGPEGGWVDYELERFSASGFAPFSVGERILKVDTAVVAIHARLMERCAAFTEEDGG